MNEIKFDCYCRENASLNLDIKEEKSYFIAQNKFFSIEIWKTTSNKCKLSSLMNVTAVKVKGLIHENNISEFTLNFPYDNEFKPCEANSHWNKSYNLTSIYINKKPNELENCLNKFINNFLTKKEKPVFINLIELFVNPLEVWKRLNSTLNDPSLPNGIRILATKLLKHTPSMMINRIVEKLISNSYSFSDPDDELKVEKVLKIQTKLKDELWSDLKKAGCSSELILEANMLLYPDDFQ